MCELLKHRRPPFFKFWSAWKLSSDAGVEPTTSWFRGKRSYSEAKLTDYNFKVYQNVDLKLLNVSRCCSGQLLVAWPNLSIRCQILELRSLLGVSDLWNITRCTCNETIMITNPLHKHCPAKLHAEMCSFYDYW